MQVKSYRGPTTKAAMDMVKADLGVDAVILSMKHHQAKGERYCEVTAALERVEVPLEEPRDDAGGDSKSLPTGAANPLFDLQRELLRMRRNFTDLMRPYMDMSALVPKHRLALEYLEREGLDSSILMELYRICKANPKQSVLIGLSSLLKTRPFGREEWPGKFHVVAGPCGVGKTSVLIRLALLLRKADQECRVCLINADEGRLGGRLLLKHYAELSGMTYIEAADQQAFERVFHASAGYDYVLVDTPAMRPSETLEAKFVKIGFPRNNEIYIHLVLSPYFSAEQFAEFKRIYASPLLSSLIWTKLDESCGFGAMVNMSASTGLPVSALSFGAGFRDTMTPAEVSAIWRLLFKHQFPHVEAAGGEKIWA